MLDINECSSNPCRNGKCVDGIDKYVCICPKGITGERCSSGI